MITLPDGTRITAVEASEHLLQYWKDIAPSVYGLFDATLSGPKNRIEAIDILSLNVLNVFGGVNPETAMATLWKQENKRKLEELLTGVTQEPIESLDESERARAADALGRVVLHVEKLNGWGPTSAAKLIYRFRPGLAPPWDTFINRYYQMPVGTPWSEFYRVAMECIAGNACHLRSALEIALESFPHRKISIVRLWDIILWVRIQDRIGPKSK